MLWPNSSHGARIRSSTASASRVTTSSTESGNGSPVAAAAGTPASPEAREA